MAKANKRLCLNLGCGADKIEGYINIDIEKTLKPDICLDFTTQRLPFKENSVDEVVMFHTIEHIRKAKHQSMLVEIRRVLKVGARLILSYPEFVKCFENWKTNKQGKREFWEATMFGRQLFPADYHVCIMEKRELQQKLEMLGYERVRHSQEPAPNEFNAITYAYKSAQRCGTYEEHVGALKYKVVK